MAGKSRKNKSKGRNGNSKLQESSKEVSLSLAKNDDSIGLNSTNDVASDMNVVFQQACSLSCTNEAKIYSELGNKTEVYSYAGAAKPAISMDSYKNCRQPNGMEFAGNNQHGHGGILQAMSPPFFSVQSGNNGVDYNSNKNIIKQEGKKINYAGAMKPTLPLETDTTNGRRQQNGGCNDNGLHGIGRAEHNRNKPPLLDSVLCNSGGTTENSVVTRNKQNPIHQNSSLEGCDTLWPSRPGYGKEKIREIKLVANNFLINFPHGEVYHYDIDISDIKNEKYTMEGSKNTVKDTKPLPSITCRKVIDEVCRSEPIFKGFLPVYDGKKSLYTRTPLPLNGYVKIKVPLKDDGKTRNFLVLIKPVQKNGNSCAVSFEPLHQYLKGIRKTVPQETIMAIDIILRHTDMPLRAVPIRRAFYPFFEKGKHPLEGGSEIWFGYHQSARAYQKGLMLNIDMAATVFHKSGPVVDYIKDILKKDVTRERRYLSEYEINKINKSLKGLQVRVLHLPYRRKFRIFKVTLKPVDKQEFSMNCEGRVIKKKVIDYFNEQHKCRLRYPYLPCLQMNPPSKEIYIPVEVCEIVEGQQYKKKLTGTQTSMMIKKTARTPQDRFKYIEHCMEDINRNLGPYAREFNIQVSTTPLELSGRILPPPLITYGGESTVVPRLGTWDMKRQKFETAVNVKKWAVVCFSPENCTYQGVKSFVSNLQDAGKSCGLILEQPKLFEPYSPYANVKEVLKKCTDCRCELVLVILNKEQDQPTHDTIKFVAETQLSPPLLTQCVLDVKIMNCKPQYLLNLCQKINAKMGGINCYLKPDVWPLVFKQPVIVIGADVNHPAPGDTVKPSIAAAVGSMDCYPAKYAFSLRVQASCTTSGKRKEVIEDLKGMIIELLRAFYRQTRCKPEKIYFYRDGVGEGQFLAVREEEIRQIQEACQTLQEDYLPALTFILVQKRHHTRFRPFYPSDGVGRSGNIPAGTTVDTDVVQPQFFDFFLCSHEGIQGTSRPTYYIVLWDDNKCTADELQKLTYYLCHTYARCTRSVSIPAPVYYAHLAAFRAKGYLASDPKLSSCNSSSSSSSGSSSHLVTYDLASFVNSIAVSRDFLNRMIFI